jgi:hypothetical protein
MTPAETFIMQCIQAVYAADADLDDDASLFDYCKYLTESMTMRMPSREWLKSVRDEIASNYKGLME